MTMFFLYLDETGTNEDANHFILGGAVISVRNWKLVNDKITDLKKDFFNDVYVDLKGLRTHKKGKLNGKKNPFYYLSPEELGIFSDKLNEIIISLGVITYFAAVINRKEFSNKYFETFDEYLISYEFIVERFEKFLRLKDANGAIHIEYSNEKLKRNLENAHDKFAMKGTGFQDIEKIIESCHFVSGPRNNFAQVADLFIASVFQKAERNNDKYYKKFRPRIHSMNGHVLGYGIKYFPLGE